jgi:hypothetical protein
MIKDKHSLPVYDLLFGSDYELNRDNLEIIPKKYWVLSMLLSDDEDTLGRCDEEGFLKADEGSEDEGSEDEGEDEGSDEEDEEDEGEDEEDEEDEDEEDEDEDDEGSE